MTTEKDIQQLAKLIERIEEYADDGVYDPSKQKIIATSIKEAKALFNRIIDMYADMTTMPPMQQTIEVSELQKRLHHVKHDIPSPPIVVESGSKLTDKRIAIYSLPT